MLTINKAAGINGVGVYATRRGPVQCSEIDNAVRRLGSRATPAQVAKMIGRCEIDVRAVMFPGGET